MSTDDLGITKDKWEEMLKVDNTFVEGDPDKYYGAGRYVKTVFDNDSKIVIGRILDATNTVNGRTDTAVSFEKLSYEHNYGGYPEYYERESVLLAKRVYRYMEENGRIDFIPPKDDSDNEKWLSLLFDGNESIGWNLKENLASAFLDCGFTEKYVLRPANQNGRLAKVLATIIEMLKEGNARHKDIENCVDNKLQGSKESTSGQLKRYSNDNLEPNEAYPKYFYKDRSDRFSPWGLTGHLPFVETEYDVCYMPDTQNVGDGKLKLFDIPSKTFQKVGGQTVNTVELFSKIEICGQSFAPTAPNKQFTYLNLLVIFFKTVSSADTGKMNEITDHYRENKNNSFRCEPKWKLEKGITKKISDADKGDPPDYNYEKAYPLDSADMWVGKVNTNNIHNDFRTLLDKFGLKDQVYVWMNKSESENIERVLKMKEDIKKLLKENKQIILTGAPGTGKTFLSRQIAEELVKKELGKGNDEDLTEDERKEYIHFCQFHPSYDYTDFVEGLRPKKLGDNSIGFERKDGIFKEFCKKAIKEPDKKFVFMIDEINRGDISKIFGELFYAIDPGYRGKKGKTDTQYQNLLKDSDDEYKDGFYVPDNVYIIGTMNDIDRSVESMDFAIRRRFIWFPIKPEDTQVAILEKTLNADEAKNLMNRINAIIKGDENNKGIDGLGEAYQLGASYFKAKEREGEEKAEVNLEDVWEYRVKPLLKEYLRGLPNETNAWETLEKCWPLNQNDESGENQDSEDA